MIPIFELLSSGDEDHYEKEPSSSLSIDLKPSLHPFDTPVVETSDLLSSSSDEFVSSVPPRKKVRRSKNKLTLSSESANSDEEAEPVTIATRKGTLISNYDPIRHPSYEFKLSALGDYYNFLTDEGLEKHSIVATSSCPWHVTKSTSVVVHLKEMAKEDVTVDCWWWIQLGSYTVISNKPNDRFKKPGKDPTLDK